MKSRVVYVVHSETDDNNILAHFYGCGNKAAALSYARANRNDQTYVERVLMDPYEDIELDEPEEVWSYLDEVGATFRLVVRRKGRKRSHTYLYDDFDDARADFIAFTEDKKEKVVTASLFGVPNGDVDCGILTLIARYPDCPEIDQ